MQQRIQSLASGRLVNEGECFFVTFIISFFGTRAENAPFLNHDNV
jgi:hypothetical protein